MKLSHRASPGTTLCACFYTWILLFFRTDLFSPFFFAGILGRDGVLVLNISTVRHPPSNLVPDFSSYISSHVFLYCRYLYCWDRSYPHLVMFPFLPTSHFGLCIIRRKTSLYRLSNLVTIFCALVHWPACFSIMNFKHIFRRLSRCCLFSDTLGNRTPLWKTHMHLVH